MKKDTGNILGRSRKSTRITSQLNVDLHYLWNVADVAEFLNVSIGHVYNLKLRNKIPWRKVGKLLYFFPEEILEWVELNGLNRRGGMK